MSQIRFVGGPWDGMKMPWGDEFPLPERLAMTKTSARIPSTHGPVSNGRAYLYDLESDDAGRFYRYVGRTAPGKPGG
jgi:hypothetical protein